VIKKFAYAAALFLLPSLGLAGPDSLMENIQLACLNGMSFEDYTKSLNTNPVSLKSGLSDGFGRAENGFEVFMKNNKGRDDWRIFVQNNGANQATCWVMTAHGQSDLSASVTSNLGVINNDLPPFIKTIKDDNTFLIVSDINDIALQREPQIWSLKILEMADQAPVKSVLTITPLPLKLFKF